MAGYFISFEGGEGSGKTTQIKLLVAWLAARGLAERTRVTREPGGAPSAEAVRSLLVEGAADRWLPATEAMLMSASRHEHVEHVLRPALAAGEIVLCDRYNDSTRVYQGVVGGVRSDAIEALNNLACGGLVPDLTILLDMDVADGLSRADGRDSSENRFESKGLAFHQNVRAAFLSLAEASPGRFAVIDAARDATAIHDDIVDIISPRLISAGVTV